MSVSSCLRVENLVLWLEHEKRVAWSEYLREDMVRYCLFLHILAASIEGVVLDPDVPTLTSPSSQV